jgi:hypothetical protein
MLPLHWRSSMFHPANPLCGKTKSRKFSNTVTETTCIMSGNCKGVSKSFRSGHLERELQMTQFFDTKCSCIAILWVSLVSFVAIILCVASQRAMPKVRIYFIIDSVRKLLDGHSYHHHHLITGFLSPGNSLEPVWTPPLRLQVLGCSTFLMHDIPLTAVCRESIEYFLGIVYNFFLVL